MTTDSLFADTPREVRAAYGRDAEMGYWFRARVEACNSFGRPRFRAIGESKHIDWRDDGWKGPKRKTAEEAARDANGWLDGKEAHPRDWSEGYV